MGTTGAAWDDVEDLEGTLHYEVLGIDRRATAEEVRRAFREKARLHHPDKLGGSAEKFAEVKRAYETLGNEERRRVYDTWQKSVEFRHVRGVASRFEGGEDLMLDEFEKRITLDGLEVDPRTQLVVVCEVCGRPATTQCWTQDGYLRVLHPEAALEVRVRPALALVNKPGHMLEQLGRKEMEKKRTRTRGGWS